jgi:pyruvate/2-oxoglutarate dehydrogenase complex dihydrolipoamide acyltransferase (E2) component
VIAKIETDKTTIDVFSPKSGVVKEILVEDGTPVKANTKIMVIDEDGSGSPAAEPVKPVEGTREWISS